MHTPVRMPRRWRQLLVAPIVGALALGAVGAVAPGSASAADPAPPTVVSLSVTPSAVTVPANPTVQLTVAGPERLSSAQVTFSEPSGRGRTLQLAMVDDGPGQYTGTASLPVKDGVENGHWKVLWVYLPTAQGTTNVCDTSWQQSYCTSTKDFSAAGLDVSGSVWDDAAPVIRSVTPPTAAVRPGESYTVAWDATDLHPLASILFRFQNKAPEARSNYFSVSTTSAAELAAGQVTAVLPPTAYDGSYVLTQIVVKDTVGNTGTYQPNGVVTLGSGAKQPTSHGLTFSAISVPVAGSTQDVTPPVLTSIGSDRASTRSQSYARFSYVSSDETSPYASIRVDTTGPSGFLHTSSSQPTVSGTGVLNVWFQEVGLNRVSKVVLTDTHLNSIEYRRDGTTYNPLTRVTGSHTLDLAALDVTVTPAAVQVTAQPHSHSVVLSWDNPYQGTGLTSYHVVASPGGAVMDVPAVDGARMTTTFSGLPNAVTHTFSVTPRSTVGDGPTVTASAMPLFSTNVWGAGDVNGDRRNDLFATLPQSNGSTTVRVYRGTNGPGFGAGTTIEAAASPLRGFARSSLFDHAAYLTLQDSSLLYVKTVYPDATLEWSYGGLSGWGMRFIDGHADFSGDGVGDIVAVRNDGSAYLYRGASNGFDYGKGTRIATGWNTMQTVFAATDVTGDRRADLLVVDRSGVLWIYPGNGNGTLAAKRKVSAGWGGLGALFTARDVTGDGKVDLGAVTMDGTLRIYRGRGNGTFGAAVSVSKGWASYL